MEPYLEALWYYTEPEGTCSHCGCDINEKEGYCSRDCFHADML